MDKKKGGGKGDKPNGNTQRVPAELIGLNPRTTADHPAGEGKNICFGFNLSKGCQQTCEQVSGVSKCAKGFHTKMKALVA